MTAQDDEGNMAALRAAFSARLALLGLADLPVFEAERLRKAYLHQQSILAGFDARLRPQDEGALLLVPEGFDVP